MTDDEIIAGIIEREGGLSEHPDDPGGITKYGITLLTLQQWRYPHTVTAEDVRALTVEEATEIYRERYVKPWAHLSAPSLREQAIDITVNSGRRTAQILLQRADGNPVTLVGERLRFYARLVKNRPNLAVFLPGWINRALHFLPGAIEEQHPS